MKECWHPRLGDGAVAWGATLVVHEAWCPKRGGNCRIKSGVVALITRRRDGSRRIPLGTAFYDSTVTTRLLVEAQPGATHPTAHIVQQHTRGNRSKLLGYVGAPLTLSAAARGRLSRDSCGKHPENRSDNSGTNCTTARARATDEACLPPLWKPWTRNRRLRHPWRLRH